MKLGTIFVLSVEKCAWQLKKAYLHKPIKILHFLIPARIQKCLTYLQNILAFLTTNHLQDEPPIQQGIFLHVIPVHIIVP